MNFFDDTPCFFSSCRTRGTSLSIYKDSAATGETYSQQSDISQPWHTLGARAERNKENNAIPGKWKSFKVLIFLHIFLFVCPSHD